MSTIADRISSLSPEKRQLLERIVQEKRLKSNGDSSLVKPIPRRELAALVPLSFAQQRLWIMDQLQPDKPLYNEHGQLRFQGQVDLVVLEHCINEVVRRHEVLRLRIPIKAGKPAPEIMEPWHVHLEIIDLRGLGGENRDSKARELATTEARQIFDLQKGPLFQIKALDLAPDEKLLLVTLHHLISDGWSMGLFATEVAALYTSALNAKPPLLPPLAVQFPDYALWQRKLWEEQKWQEQLEYWKQQLQDAAPYLDLPLDGRYSEVQSFAGSVLRRELPQALSNSIRSLSTAHAVTPFVVLLAAFKLLLWRSSPQQEINISVPVSGRNHLDLEPLIGMFINVVVLRTTFQNNASFLELMQRVHAASVAAYRNQEVSFDKLIEELQPERKLHRNPFSDVLFNFLNFPGKPFQLPGLQISREDLHDPIARFPLTVYIDDRPQGFVVRFLYQTELFSAAQMAAWMDQFEHLLEQIVTEPSRQLEDFSLVTPRARQVLPDPSQGLPLVPQATVVEKILQRAAAHPELCAVQHQGVRHDYRELTQRAREIAEGLVSSGLKPNEVVAVTGNRGFGLIAAMLGTFMARGVLLMLDPRLPAGRRLLMMHESHARALLCAGTGPVSAAAGLICLQVDDRNASLLSAVAKQKLELPQVLANDPAYIFFTSGTTGTPKAILGWHAGLGHFLSWQQQSFSVSSTEKFAQLTGLSFDVVLRDILLPLVSGAALLVPEDTEDLAFDKITPWLKEERITGIHTTPSIAHSWLAHAKEQCPLPSLKYVFFAGEPLTDTLVRQWRKTFPGPAQLINLYGPTETTLAKCFYRVPPDEQLRAATQPVGYPLPQTQVLILRSGNRLCGFGELGEIVVRTPFRSLGYANAPEEQSARFVPNPWTNDPSDLLYHTGDLGRYRADGAIEIAGRLDDQIKIRGVRIQPEEITATLSRHASVQACFVVAVKSQDAGNTLIAYVVSTNASGNTQELRTYLGHELPGSMVPSAFVFLEKLPLTANGKVDRKALPLPSLADAERKKTPPRTGVEAELAEIWGRTLKLKEVGIDDNFFELGGHSLLAIELMYETRTHFGVDLPLAALFQQPTVAGLATVIEHRLASGGRTSVKASALPAILPDVEHRHELFQMTDIQQAYWVGRSNDLELGNVATHNYSEFEFLDLDITGLRNAFQRLIERHDMLRAVVRSDGFQQILPETPRYEIAFHDLRGDQQQREKAIEEIRWQLSHQILPLDNWPLFEFLVTRWDEHIYRLHISVDALICDAWSRRILGRELLLLYREPEKVLPPLELSFRDYVMAERAFRETEAYHQAEEYWDSRLATLAPAPQLPLSRNLAEHVKPRFIRFHGELDAENWQRIKSRARRAGLTSSALVCAAYAEVLAFWSASLRFTINLTLFQRMPLHPQVNDVVGDFTSLILLEVDHRAECFEKRARQIQEQLWRDLDNSSCSGVKVLRKLHQREGGMARALMPVVLTSTLVDEVHGNHELISAWRRELRTAISQTPQVYLDHQVSEEDGHLYFNWDVVKEAFPEGVVEEMFGAYCSLLRSLGENQEVWLQPSRVEGLLPARQQQLRQQVNATQVLQESGLIQDAFFAQAEKRGPAIAVVSGGRQLSYRELARFASGYGEQLRHLGAQPNRLIAIVMEKGWEQVVAALAIVESGAAYLPIDARWPLERRRQLLEIGEVKVVLTQPQWAAQDQGWPAGVRVLVVDEAGPKREQRLEKSSVREQDLAYVIFTSGSTGVPKGVMMEHGPVWNTIADINQRLALTPEDAVLGISSLSFDLSVYDIFGVLGAGGKLVLPGAEEGRDPSRWLEQMRADKVSVWNSVPALMEMLVEYVEGCGESLPESLRVVMMSGDWIPVSLPGRMKKLAGEGLQILSLGGATEAAIWSILYPIAKVEEGWKSIPYGKPLANQRFYVLKENGELSPEWVPGQLYIGGVGLARGYWRDEEKTRERFQQHAGLGERLYWTGDLGRYLPDGNIEFLGREDAQVKIQGFRIELGEIESALRKHAGVKEALVTVVGSSGPGSKRLAAYVVAQDNASVTEKDLRNFLAALLPEYMVPHAFMLLESFPLSSNGKIDRKALPSPEWLTKPADEQAELKRAPENVVQEIVASICAEFLHAENVAVHENLFALGADSVMAVRMLTRLHDVFQVHLSLRAFFEEPTIASLSQALVLATRNSSSDLPPMEQLPAAEELYLSFAQERLWFLCHVEPESPFYNLGLALRLTGDIDPGILQHALNHLVQRHETLRASFSVVRGQAVLRILPEIQVELEQSDLDAPSSSAVLATINHEFRQPFDLQKAPLLRGRLFQISPSEHILVLTVHHIISDAWSLDILNQELAVLYAQLVQGKTPELAPLPLQYSAFAYWQRKSLGPEYLETELSYWQRTLDGAQPLELRTGHSRATVSTRSMPGAREAFAFADELSKSLESFSRKHGVTLYMTLLAGFYIVLHRYSGQEDLVLGTSVSHRHVREMQGVIGCFLNTILVRARCSGASRVHELLQQVREITVGAYAHQTVPFEEVARKLGDRALTQALSSRVVFGLRNSPSTYQQIPGVTWERVPLERGTTKFELEVQLIHKDGSLSGFADYDTRLFEPQTIRQFLQEFQTILLHISRDADVNVESLLINLPPLSDKSKTMTDNSVSSPRRKAFKDFKTAPVKVSADQLVQTKTFNGNPLPLVIEAAVQGIDLADWIHTNEKMIREQLCVHGAALFRGFSVNTTDYFQKVVNAFSPQLMEYTERSTPRTKVNGNVYTSTEYPADQSIPLHNENSYSHVWPEKIWFLCMQPAQTGGETPIADGRQILKLLDPQIVQLFTEKQVMYVRNFREGLGLSWQEAFQTSDPATVERYCQQSGIQFEWVSPAHLRTRQVRPSVLQHPETGEPVWFNQAHLFHFSSLDEKVRQSMQALYREEDFPRTAYFGDGSEIGPEVLAAVHQAYQQASIVFPWKLGDLLLVDNILTAHGRRPYSGARKIVVLMSEPSTQHAKTYTAHQ